MSSSTTATRVTAKRGGSSDAGAVQQSTIYKVIMTPIILVSFLLSLAWVDLTYTIRRSRNHGRQGWMPSWLHSILYRKSQYRYAEAKDQKTPTTTPSPKDEREEFYYHSKQKKLLRMEVDDAFQLRGHVLVVMTLVLLTASLAFAWGGWMFSGWVWRSYGERAFDI
ncbi:hypothetical protein CORC01_06853 [Colletotrichum orchidophilum]|uniref:ATP phosphoribosyltransferase n=1 Tax=Colletotrichum orchidophilum TaxID=1209926 RepID=A0A1G4B8M9_9PEZI|nr:uncharacterized protein CORC01_06853 [Colletotrichum orchidophilum]OHE97818.1 hypothetical protein CORC01_06853 [Colletotrichum orchidophilum]